MPLLLFEPNVYAKLLRFMRYGGGYELQIWTDQPEQNGKTWYLVLRTADVLILIPNGTNGTNGKDIVEMPLENIRQVAYKNEIEPFRLPEQDWQK